VKHNHEEQTIHPCQFPEDLVARVILATTSEGDVVLDPYMGSGTVAVVARDYGRHYIGAEFNETYYATAEQRLSGQPDRNGCFPNLKTLRDYVEKTGNQIERYRYAKQVGARATDRFHAKIHTEEHHREDLERRLEQEEAAFGVHAKRKGC
jgi:adenine-specific DNA-methyltransferase